MSSDTPARSNTAASSDTAAKKRGPRPEASGGNRGLGLRWHLALTYLLIMWVTLAVITIFVSRSLERASIENRKAYLFAQAHQMATIIRARGGPGVASVSDTGGVPYRGRVLVIDANGRVVEDSAMDPAMPGRDLIGVVEVSRAMDGAQVANTYYLPDGTFVMYLAVPGNWEEGTGAVFVSQELQDVVDQYRGLMRAVLLGGGLASVAAIILAWFLSRVVVEPVLELAETAGRMSSGRLDLRVKPRGPRETRILGESFNSMASGIVKTMRTQEEFLAAAAHELRSPLAALSVLVESMQAQPPTAEEMPEFLSDMRGELNRIISTTEGILDLLRSRGRFEESGVNPETELRSIIQTRTRSLSAGIDVRLELDGPASASQGFGKGPVENVLFALSPVAFRLVASNLLDNAIKYSRPGGVVTVRCYVSGDDLVLSVRDQGIGIAASAIPRLFEPFYRVDSARRKSTGGAGLGLAIVKEACDRTGATISVDSEVGQGSTFTVTWRGVGRKAEDSRGGPESY